MENQHNNQDHRENIAGQKGRNADNDKLNAAGNASNARNRENDTDGTDKYLAMEQPGVTFTHDTDPTVNSDQMDFGSESRKNQWNAEGGNSKYSEAFNQDDYLLEDNLDLDEDQNQSVSSDDEDFEETNERYTN